MGCGTDVQCASCGAHWGFSAGTLVAIADNGDWIACPHPCEHSSVEAVLGKENASLWWNPRLRFLSCSLCLACWEIGHYCWSWQGIDAAAGSDFCIGDGMEKLGEAWRSILAWIPSGHTRRCRPGECVVCGRWRPWLLWPSWLSELVLVPTLFRLKCPRCQKRGIQTRSWLS